MTGICANCRQRLATLRVRMAYVGDRELCWYCWQALSSAGMDIRRLDEPTSLPAWRQRLTAKDYTGTVA